MNPRDVIGEYVRYVMDYAANNAKDSRAANEAFAHAKRLERELLAIPEKEWVNVVYPLLKSDDTAVVVFASICLIENCHDKQLVESAIGHLRCASRQPGLVPIQAKYYLLSKKL